MSYPLQPSGAEAAHQSKIRVVVADDHPIVRAGITAALSHHSQIEVCGEAVNGDEALQVVQISAPDVLVLDISMPGLQATEVLNRAGALPTPPWILILTFHCDLENILSMLKAGAKGYVLKDEDPAVIVEAVQAVAHGQTWLSAAVTAMLVSHATQGMAGSGEPAFSTREREVLRLLAEGKDNQRIGAMLGITERTVRYHLRNIYDKLGVRRRGEAIVWAVQRRGDATQLVCN